jgi:sec-independent protein translocase protein TatB
MLDIGWSELVIIGVVALVVVGPKELPTLLRTVGQWVGKARRMAAEFQGQLNDAIREAELEDVKKSVDDLRSLSPTKLVTDQLTSIGDEVKSVGAAAQSQLDEATATPLIADRAEAAGISGSEAEKLIDAAAPQIDDTVFDLTPAPMPVAAPAPEPVPAAIETAEAPAAAETDKKATGA